MHLQVDVDNAHVAAVSAACPYDELQPTCAAAEWQLMQWRRAGTVRYDPGGSDVICLSEDKTMQRRVHGIAAIMCKVHEASTQTSLACPAPCTGVLRVIDRAVALCPPVVVYPVQDFASMSSVALEGDAGKPMCLRHCVLVKHRTTIEDIYTMLKHPPLNALSGDFVRGEAYHFEQQKSRPAKKSDIVLDGAAVRIMTNRKSRWQHTHHT